MTVRTTVVLKHLLNGGKVGVNKEKKEVRPVGDKCQCLFGEKVVVNEGYEGKKSCPFDVNVYFKLIDFGERLLGTSLMVFFSFSLN
jgi:hypothetical protein